MVRQRAAGQPDRVGRHPQVAAHEREVAGLDRDVGAGAHREAQVGLGERGGVVDAVADHRDHAALAPAGAARRRPCRPAAPRRRRRSVDARPRRPTAARRPRLSPVSSTGRSPSSRSCGDRLGRRRLHRVGDDQDARGPRRPTRRRRRCGRPPAPARRALGRSRAEADQSASRRGGRRATAWPSTTPWTPSPSVLVKSSTGGRCRARSAAPRRSPGRSGARCRPRAPRRGAGPRRRPRRPAATTSTSAHPAGGHRAGLVEHAPCRPRGWARAPRGP